MLVPTEHHKQPQKNQQVCCCLLFLCVLTPSLPPSLFPRYPLLTLPPPPPPLHTLLTSSHFLFSFLHLPHFPSHPILLPPCSSSSSTSSTSQCSHLLQTVAEEQVSELRYHVEAQRQQLTEAVEAQERIRAHQQEQEAAMVSVVQGEGMKEGGGGGRKRTNGARRKGNKEGMCAGTGAGRGRRTLASGRVS